MTEPTSPTAGAGKFTPGPWSRVPQNRGGDLIAREYETGDQMNPKGLRLVTFMMARGDSLREDEANAALISAAPEMYEALKAALPMLDEAREALTGDDMICCVEGEDGLTLAIDQIRAAIRKAEGQ